MAATPGHLDRLSTVDASFLHQERDASHMHVGGVVIFEGPPPSHEELVDHLLSRMSSVPRYRQKLTEPPFELGRPFWIDDPSFNLDYHLRFTGLPAPGSLEQLRALVGRIFSQRLDRSKPLWEFWLVQGLEDNRFALISKTHHAMVDGVAGVDISTVLFDTSPVPEERPPDGGDGSAPPEQTGDHWTPAPEPSTVDLVGEAVKDAVRAPFGLAGRALGV